MGNQPIRVLQFISSMNRGGPQDFIMSMYRQVDRSKLQFDFLMFSPNPSDYEEEIRALGGHVLILPKASQTGTVGFLLQLVAAIRKHGPYQAIHSHMDVASGPMLLAARLLGIPARIVQVHEVSPLLSLREAHPLLYRFEARLVKRLASHVIASSTVASQLLSEQFMRPPHTMLYGGIEIERYVHLKAGRGPLRAKLGIAEDELVIGHSGKFTAAQNQKRLIEIFEELCIRVPRVRLVLAGDGALRKDIQALIAAKGLDNRVHLLGSEVCSRALLQLLDVLVVPAFRAGVPRIVVEAQAAGVPCVVSEALPEEACVGAGFYKNIPLEWDVAEWAQWIMKALQSEFVPAEQRTAALRRAGFDQAANASMLEAVYIDHTTELVAHLQKQSQQFDDRIIPL
ncbi:glycosyltransferase [Paenibacillus whitsoniae]|uniref:Glycosyltransferase n=1 Tax=Paenibacillus whitsoniae TaxID=2496558 RepID=A0A3S0C6M1_9BACL|nr:glycosyltransferase [Paenibacillus whitsoniae]RTE06272.1 glycosyltransferase [Paenibacillus whitsoniae]